MNIAIVDYEAGNTGSIKYALEQLSIPSYIARLSDDLFTASHIIFPGVGSFNNAMQVLQERALDVAIKQLVLEKKIPFLGICLGMQLLATTGSEGGEIAGLNLIPGSIELLPITKNLRLPHIGWNEVNFQKKHPLLQDIPSRTDFYFLHSYHFIANSEESIAAQTSYGKCFNSVIIKDHIMGVQFHPEKSGRLGRQLFKNFVSL